MENNSQENKNNNGNLFLIITIIVVIALGIFWFTKFDKRSGGFGLMTQSTNPLKGQVVEVDRSEIISSGEFCFALLEAKDYFKDKFGFQIYVAENGDTRGILTLSPAEKDKKTGKIYGTITHEGDAQYFRGWFDSFAEGVENTEQLFIKIEEDKSTIAFGEMEESENVYIYKYPENVNYNLEIPKVFCGVFDEIMNA